MSAAKSCEEIYAYLKANLPGRPDQKMNELLDKLNTVRLSLLLRERLHCIYPLLLGTSRMFPKEVIPKNADDDALFNIMRTTRLLSAQEVRPAFMQVAGLLIRFIYENIDTFAVAICNHVESPSFGFLVYSAVPMVFGFFTSAEQIQHATKFYLCAIRHCEPYVFGFLVRPFLNSLISFRFIESVMNRVAKDMGTDETIFDEENAVYILRKYTDVLTTAILRALPCLPSEMFRIFREIFDRNWERREILDLFFTHFLVDKGIEWIRASPYTKIEDFFKRTCETVMSNDGHITKILNALFVHRSLCDAPSLYLAFDQQFMSYVATVADIVLVAECYSSVGDLPPTLQNLTFDDYPKDVRFYPFLVKAYPDGMTCVDPCPQRIVFSAVPEFKRQSFPDWERKYHVIKEKIKNERNMNPYEYTCMVDSSNEELKRCTLEMTTEDMIKSALKFEKFLAYKVWFQEVVNWNSLSRDRNGMVLMKRSLMKCEMAEKKRVKDGLTSLEVFKRASMDFESLHIKKVQYMTAKLPDITNFIQTHFEDLKNLRDSCRAVINQKRGSCNLNEISSLSVLAQRAFWEATYGVLKNIKTAPRARQFELIMCAIRVIDQLSGDDPQVFMDRLAIAVEMANADTLPGVFLLLNSFAVKDSTFRQLIDEADQALWLKFETFMLIFIECPAVPGFRDVFLRLQSTIVAYESK